MFMQAVKQATEAIALDVRDETSSLEAVVVGIGSNISPKRYMNNPKEAESVRTGTFPSEAALVAQQDAFTALLTEQGVTVYRPEDAPEMDQIFPRDIAFVIGDRLVRAHMRKANRRGEYEQIAALIDAIDTPAIEAPAEAFIEGGDVILHPGYVFVGQSERTNAAGAAFLADSFPDLEVIPLELVTTDDPHTNVLHLDCAFQPVGSEHALFYADGFRKRPDAIYDLFGERNLISLTGEEMYHLMPNIFSVSPTTVVSEPGFTRINDELRRIGLTVLETPYHEVGKIGGLLRCSTLPLRRRYTASSFDV